MEIDTSRFRRGPSRRGGGGEENRKVENWCVHSYFFFFFLDRTGKKTSQWAIVVDSSSQQQQQTDMASSEDPQLDHHWGWSNKNKEPQLVNTFQLFYYRAREREREGVLAGISSSSVCSSKLFYFLFLQQHFGKKNLILRPLNARKSTSHHEERRRRRRETILTNFLNFSASLARSSFVFFFS